MYSEDFHPYYRNSWALVVGINDYEHAGPLLYARNDAESMASLLVSRLGFRPEQVVLIKDREATKEAILRAYLEFVDTANSPDDRVLFFFAGHGVTLDGYQGPVGYLVPANGRPDRPASLIRWDELTRNADLIPAKHILFVLDACFSGLALKRAVYSGVQRFLSEMLQRRSRQVITAGKADEVVADGGGPEGKNSIFTGYLLEGLNGAAASEGGVLTANGLMHYVYERLAQDPNSQQTPHYGHIDGDGDFVLIAPADNLHATPERDLIVETLPEMPGAQQPTAIYPSQPAPSFAEANGYLNPSSPSFGRNSYSEKLGTFDLEGGREEVGAFSWLGIVVEPLSGQDVGINLSDEAKRFANYTPQGEVPFEHFLPPKEVMTTISSVVLFNRLSYASATYWGSYVRIEKSGNLEFCDSRRSFFAHRDMRAFRFVQIVGLTWQFMFFARYLLAENGYPGAARVLVNLVGTKDTILADFAKGPGRDKHFWVEPADRAFLLYDEGPPKLKCPDRNLQLQYNLVLGNLNEQSSREIINGVAGQLGLAYNHQSEPRCFNYGTNVFPWQQFLSNQG